MLAGALALAGTLHAGGLATLARSGQWRKVLEIARVREAQLPLSPSESLIVAQAAAVTGEWDTEQTFLAHALGDPDTGDVAAVLLAQPIVDEDPARAFDLVFPVLRKAPSSELRGAAAAIIRTAVLKGVHHRRRRRLERILRRLPRLLRREESEALAETAGAPGRRRLAALLKRSAGDLPALRAARALQRNGSPSGFEQWLIAQTLYRHAAYGEAERLLDRLAHRRIHGVPAWKVRFLRGRCAFRLSQFKRAGAWYQRALSATRRRSERADLLVHLARARELDGDLAGAIRAAGAALRTRGSDGRRILLLRLELRQDRFDAATRLLAKIRSWRQRDRGRILMAIAWHRKRHPSRTLALLRQVRTRSWKAPALIAAARTALERGDPELALSSLQSAARAGPGPFWRDVARRQMSRLPVGLVRQWRSSEAQELAHAQSSGNAGAILRRWASLEPSQDIREKLRARVAASRAPKAVPDFRWRGHTAHVLWSLGLNRLAVRWDPGGFPVNGVTAAAWSAEQMLLGNRAAWAIRYAAAAAGSHRSRVPACLLPPSVQMAAYPLPLARLVVPAAREAGIDPSLLAGLVREESHWKNRALSRVGARGLTQLMPATARRIATSIGLKPPTAEGLFDPAVALRLGAHELARLLKAFGGRRAPAVAAYNAGEAQAKLWLDSCGTDCPDAWYVLTIDFAATRTYTAAVLAAARRYANLYPALSGNPSQPRPTPATLAPPARPGLTPSPQGRTMPTPPPGGREEP